MAKKKAAGTLKKVAGSKKELSQKELKKHPFETDSQIENRYGNGREKSGSDKTNEDGCGSNH